MTENVRTRFSKSSTLKSKSSTKWDREGVVTEGPAKGIQCLLSPTLPSEPKVSIASLEDMMSRDHATTLRTIEIFLQLDSHLDAKGIEEIMSIVKDRTLTNMQVIKKLRPFFRKNVPVWQGISRFIINTSDPSKHALKKVTEHDETKNSSSLPKAEKELDTNVSRSEPGDPTVSGKETKRSSEGSSMDSEEIHRKLHPFQEDHPNFLQSQIQMDKVKSATSNIMAGSKFFNAVTKVRKGVAFIRNFVKMVGLHQGGSSTLFARSMPYGVDHPLTIIFTVSQRWTRPSHARLELSISAFNIMGISGFPAPFLSQLSNNHMAPRMHKAFTSLHT
ncbi:hypothetical protein PoB_002924900 [Plakobranchus ocellatus]|uniref:Uncharacterized protein n=1 Tax=Plakobranchus ocellatus TaxID=259542 RepID=A0AAV4A932_9GAST|nr:hypothetical protein PoB_002924900 [Plakobranchus ocellatus]